MATRKNDEERLQELEKKMAQLAEQKKAIQARVSDAKRKADTRRKIQFGALAGKYFDCKDIEPEEFEKLLKKVVAVGAVQELILSRKVAENEKAVPEGDEPIIDELGNGDFDAE